MSKDNISSFAHLCTALFTLYGSSCLCNYSSSFHLFSKISKVFILILDKINVLCILNVMLLFFLHTMANSSCLPYCPFICYLLLQICLLIHLIHPKCKARKHALASNTHLFYCVLEFIFSFHRRIKHGLRKPKIDLQETKIYPEAPTLSCFRQVMEPNFLSAELLNTSKPEAKDLFRHHLLSTNIPEYFANILKRHQVLRKNLVTVLEILLSRLCWNQIFKGQELPV